MNSVVLGLQLALGVLFATAAVAKLLDQPGSREALEGFGVPSRLIPAGGLLLPLAELATAVALVVHPTARWGALAALALLLAFIGGIARALARGETPDCHCFGQLHSAPAGARTLARNGALAVLALVVLVHGPGTALDAWIAARTDTELAASAVGVLAAALALVCVRLWLDNRSLREDLERERAASAVFPPGLPVGAAAPHFTLPDLDGDHLSLESLLKRRQPVALVFTSPGCVACAELLPEIGRWQATLAGQLTIAVLSTGGPEENRYVREHGVTDVGLQGAFEVFDAYRMKATPSAVIVAPDGRVASATAVGAPAVEPLIRLSLRQRTGMPEAVRPANGARPREESALSLWHSD